MTDTVDPELLQDLVDANHILFDQGVVDAFGHVSVRDPQRPDRFLMARSMAPGLVGPEDILAYGMDGEPIDAQGQRVYLERFIHSEIYRARQDVNAVVHSHSPSVVPFSISRTARLRPVCHMSGFLGEGAALFEIRDVAGDASDLLISSPELGAALARSLADSKCVLMRGHGSTVVATSLKLVVYTAVYTEVNARLQSEAMRLGDPVYLTPGEAAATFATNSGVVDRPWQLWKAAARRSAAAAAAAAAAG